MKLNNFFYRNLLIKKLQTNQCNKNIFYFTGKMRDNHCKVCGFYDDYYDENSGVQHIASSKHQYNLILYHYNLNK